MIAAAKRKPVRLKRTGYLANIVHNPILYIMRTVQHRLPARILRRQQSGILQRINGVAQRQRANGIDVQVVGRHVQKNAGHHGRIDGETFQHPAQVLQPEHVGRGQPVVGNLPQGVDIGVVEQHAKAYVSV